MRYEVDNYQDEAEAELARALAKLAEAQLAVDVARSNLTAFRTAQLLKAVPTKDRPGIVRPADRNLTSEELAARLGVHADTVRRWSREPGAPCTKIGRGGRARWNYEEACAWRNAQYERSNSAAE